MCGVLHIKKDDGVILSRNSEGVDHRSAFNQIVRDGLDDVSEHPVVPVLFCRLNEGCRCQTIVGYRTPDIGVIDKREESQDKLSRVLGELLRGAEHDERGVGGVRCGDGQVTDSRPGQDEILGHILSGEDRDVKVVFPIIHREESKVGGLSQQGADRIVCDFRRHGFPLLGGQDDDAVLCHFDNGVDIVDLLVGDVIDTHFPTPSCFVHNYCAHLLFPPIFKLTNVS